MTLATDTLTFRQATLDDLEMLLDWRMTVLAEVFEQDFVNHSSDWEYSAKLRAANLDYYIENIPTGGHIAIFAYYGDVVVGCGGICIQQELPSPDNLSGRCAYLMNIYVKSEYRQHDVGHRLVKHLIEVAKTKNVGKITLETSECGRRLYESLGFKDLPDIMKLELGMMKLENVKLEPVNEKL